MKRGKFFAMVAILVLLTGCATPLQETLTFDSGLQGQCALVFRPFLGGGAEGNPVWVRVEGPTEANLTLIGENDVKCVVGPPGQYQVTLSSPLAQPKYIQMQMGANSRLYVRAKVMNCGAYGWLMFGEPWYQGEIAEYEAQKR
ncbi:MAG: hypothetical protein WC708_09145 [Lentisphaeria bacterium]